MIMPKDEKPSNNDHENSISPLIEAAYRQYERCAEDWRLHQNLIWQIPSVAIAIIGGILTVSYSFLNGIPRAILLGIGSVLIFALTTALAKHRLGAQARSQFLLDLETETFRVKQIPTTTKDIKEYLKDRPLTDDHRLFRFLIKRSSEIWLLRVMFGIFIAMSILVILQIVIIVVN
jgi:hypothetical protein